MEKSQQVYMMRKSIEKLTGSSAEPEPEPEKYEDFTLMRFLIARSMEPEKAAKMFVQWQKWRNDLVPLGYIPESQVEDELQTKKVYLQGLSKNGFPVVLVQVRKHFSSKDQLQFQKFVVHVLDKTIARAFNGSETGKEKLIAIVDLKDISYKNADVRAFITGFQFLQAYYPERLSKCYLLHMPRFFVTIWRLISRVLDKATINKIVIVTNEDERRGMIEEIGEETLPAEYGGRSNLTTIQDVVLPHFTH